MFTTALTKGPNDSDRNAGLSAVGDVIFFLIFVSRSG